MILKLYHFFFSPFLFKFIKNAYPHNNHFISLICFSFINSISLIFRHASKWQIIMKIFPTFIVKFIIQIQMKIMWYFHYNWIEQLMEFFSNSYILAHIYHSVINCFHINQVYFVSDWKSTFLDINNFSAYDFISFFLPKEILCWVSTDFIFIFDSILTCTILMQFNF